LSQCALFCRVVLCIVLAVVSAFLCILLYKLTSSSVCVSLSHIDRLILSWLVASRGPCAKTRIDNPEGIRMPHADKQTDSSWHELEQRACCCTLTCRHKSVLSLLRLSARRCPHLLLSAGSCGSIFPACRALGNKPASRRCCCRSRDGQTDTGPLHKPCCACYVSSVSAINLDIAAAVHASKKRQQPASERAMVPRCAGVELARA